MRLPWRTAQPAELLLRGRWPCTPRGLEHRADQQFQRIEHHTRKMMKRRLITVLLGLAGSAGATDGDTTLAQGERAGTPAPEGANSPTTGDTNEPNPGRAIYAPGLEPRRLEPRPVEPEPLSQEDVDSVRAGNKHWQLEPTIYFLLAGMAGEVEAYGYSADVDMSFRSLVDHLKFGAMGRLRFAYDRFSLAVDVYYLNVSGKGINVTADASQWLVEPSVGFRIIDELEVLGGVRYNNLHLELRGDYPTVPNADFNFWDPFIGARATLPISESVKLQLRADIGGFGIGSRVSWQVYPYVSIGLAGWASIEAGYRVFQTTYHTGSGITELDYDVITYGPQLGLTFHF
jgi:hypothetical protein